MKRMVVKAQKFHIGLADGFNSTDGYFINTTEGKRYVNFNDFVVTCLDGTRFILNESLFNITFSKIEEELQLEHCPFCKTPFDNIYLCKGDCLEECNCRLYE